MSGGKSQYLEGKLLDHVLSATVFVPPAPSVFVALFKVTPAEDGTGGTEVSTVGTGYARATVLNTVGNWPAATLGDPTKKTNGAAINYVTAITDWTGPGENIVAFAIFDALVAGNCLYWGELITLTSEVPFAANAVDTPTLRAPQNSFANGDTVRLSKLHSNDTLPAPLADRTTYFVVNRTTDTIQLSLTSGGAAIVLTGDGSGKVGKIAAKPVLAGDTWSFGVGTVTIAED